MIGSVTHEENRYGPQDVISRSRREKKSGNYGEFLRRRLEG